jgi:hypothetical protein
MEYECLYSDLDATTIYVKSQANGELIAAFEKDLEAISIDRATAKTIKLQLRAECKELNRRTLEHKLAEFRELQKSTKSSRSRAKTARANDILKQAEEHIRSTMPLKPATPPTQDPHTHTPGPSDFMNSIPRGRKSGEKK